MEPSRAPGQPKHQGLAGAGCAGGWSHRRRSLNPVLVRKRASLFLFLRHPQPRAEKIPFTPGSPKQRGTSAALRAPRGASMMRSRALHQLAKIWVFQNNTQLRFYSQPRRCVFGVQHLCPCGAAGRPPEGPGQLGLVCPSLGYQPLLLACSCPRRFSGCSWQSIPGRGTKQCLPPPGSGSPPQPYPAGRDTTPLSQISL